MSDGLDEKSRPTDTDAPPWPAPNRFARRRLDSAGNPLPSYPDWIVGRREFHSMMHLFGPAPAPGKIGWTRIPWRSPDGELKLVDVMDFLEWDRDDMSPAMREGRWILVHRDDLRHHMRAEQYKRLRSQEMTHD